MREGCIPISTWPSRWGSDTWRWPITPWLSMREAEDFRMLIFGVAMVLIMIWRPRGLIATREALEGPRRLVELGAAQVGFGKRIPVELPIAVQRQRCQ